MKILVGVVAAVSLVAGSAYNGIYAKERDKPHKRGRLYLGAKRLRADAPDKEGAAH